MFKKLVDIISTMRPVSSGPHHGLVNKGATCYLNSILQVLFMTKDFREAVQRLASNSCTKYIDGHLKELFDDLLKQTGDASNIIKALGIDREYEQQDAAQYFERILRLTSPEAAKIFQGQLAHRTICVRCQTVIDVGGPFWHLPLPLVDCPGEDYSVVDGIRKFFRTTDFSGDNQMFCDKCDDKVDATSQYVIKHHPDVLILLLKRFDFSFSHMSYVKINCLVDVPSSVKIPENEVYELYAVVDHFGDLRSGHYTAMIKSQDEEDGCYIFNDAFVTRINYHPFQDNETVKSSSAYLLIYKKKDIGTQNIMEMPTNDGSPPATSENCDQSHDAETSTDRQEAADSSKTEMSVDPECIRGHSEINNMQAGPQSHQTCDERTSLDLGDSPQEAHVKDLERGRGVDENTEEDVKDENRSLLSAPENEGPVESKLKAPSGNYFKPEVNEGPPVHTQVNEQDQIIDPQSSAIDTKIDENEGTEKREKLQTEHLSVHAAHPEGFSNVSLNIHAYQGDKQSGGKDDSLKSAPVGKQVPEMRMETDVKDETRNMKPNTEDEEHQSKRGASSPRPHESESVVDQDQRDADDDYLNKLVEQICVGYEECKNDGVEEHAANHENEEDVCYPTQTESDHSGKLINQEAGSNGQMGLNDSEVRERSTLERFTDGECHSKESTLVFKIIDTELKWVPSDGEGSSKTQAIITEMKVSCGTLKRLVQKKKEAVNRKSDPANDAVASLPADVSSMTLDELPVAEQQEHKTNRVTGKAAVKKKEVHLNVHRMNNVCGAKLEAVGMKYIHKKRFPHKKKRWCNLGLMALNRKKKQNRMKRGGRKCNKRM